MHTTPLLTQQPNARRGPSNGDEVTWSTNGKPYLCVLNPFPIWCRILNLGVVGSAAKCWNRSQRLRFLRCYLNTNDMARMVASMRPDSPVMAEILPTCGLPQVRCSEALYLTPAILHWPSIHITVCFVAHFASPDGIIACCNALRLRNLA